MNRDANIRGIAVDGGGTRCRIVYFDGDRCKTVEVGPTNVSSDFDGAMTRLKSGLAQIADIAPTPLSALPAYLGLAGVTGPDLSAKTADALPFKHLLVEDDRRSALVGALGQEDGAIAHCGTGSFFAAQCSGAVRFAGGWGSVLGDEASAYWIAKKALNTVLKAADGLCPTSPMTQDIMGRFGTTDAIVAHAGNCASDQLATLAQYVTRHAASGDAHAVTLMKSAADHIEITLHGLGWTPEQALCLTGGIAPHFQPYLQPEISASLITPKGSPLDGAITLCKQMMQPI